MTRFIELCFLMKKHMKQIQHVCLTRLVTRSSVPISVQSAFLPKYWVSVIELPFSLEQLHVL